MSDHINGIRSGSYRKEIIDTLQKLVKGMLLQPDYQHISIHLCGVPFQWCEKRDFIICELFLWEDGQCFIALYGFCADSRTVYQ